MKNRIIQKWNRLVFLLLPILLISCTDENETPFFPSLASTSSLEYNKNIDGFVLVKANGKSTFLGSNASGVRNSETPQMEVRFTYDFYISEHEVSRGEYNALRKDAGAECEGECNDNSPVTNVTYYDAILYANAKSKAENLDTVYTYEKASFGVSGGCVELSGLAFHENVNGYRQGWNPLAGWNSENSDYAYHDVATSQTNDLGVYDMAGNVLEWVNDWLTYFADKVVTNFVGGSDGGSLGERVVKGGSFRNEPSVMNTYSRGDVYTVTASAKGVYLGFRLALGAIPKATWLDERGNVKESIVNVSMATFPMKHLTGTFVSKLVFRNDVTGNLSYIYFGDGVNSVVEIKDTLHAYHPDISPDGSKVAFCTGLEGISGKSKLYVRNLDVEGSNLVQLDVESAAIPRWRVSRGDTVIVYVTDAGNNADESSFKGASTWQVKFENGKFGKPQKLFDGAYHGGISDDNLLAVSGARVLRARSARPGARTASDINELVWYNGEQACNVSLAKDKSKRTLFLDFGGETGQKFVGKKYRTHERLLVTDNGGDLIQTVAAPKGYTFDHSEWASGDSGLVVATLTNTKGAHQKIALVHLADSSIVELMEGDDLWHPCLWVKPRHFVRDGIKLDLDSAGIYFNEWGGEAAAILRYKMELLWKYWDTANVVIMGSSRPLDGVNPSLLDKKFFALNMAHVPNMMASSDYLMTNYVFPHVTNLKYVVISLDIDMWYRSEKTESNFFYKEYKNYPGYVYDRDHKFWVPRAPDELEYLTEESMGAESYFSNFVETRGFNPADPNTWESKPSVENDSTWMSERSAYYYANMKHLKNILTQAKEKDVYVIGVIFPQSPGYKKTGALGRYGIRRSEGNLTI